MDKKALDHIQKHYIYEKETGHVFSKISFDRETGGFKKIGFVNSKGYIRIFVKGKSLQGHRVAWFMHYGEWPRKDMDVDHINRNKVDNRIENLRLVSRPLNNQNSLVTRTKDPTNLIGASLIKTRKTRPWRASIKIMGKTKLLGHFDTKKRRTRPIWTQSAFTTSSLKFNVFTRRRNELHTKPRA